MIEKSYKKDEWQGALAKLAKESRVIAPVNGGTHSVFKTLEEGDVPDFKSSKTRLSPKSVVFPQSERMFEYSLDEESEENGILKEAKKDYAEKFVAGIRPCDARSFKLVQVNFDTPTYKDPWWINNYESTTFIGQACNKACSTCFCTSTGGSPFGEEGLDVVTVDMGDSFLVKSVTDKGEKLLNTIGGGADATDDMKTKVAELEKAAVASVKSEIKTDNLKELKETDLFEADFWKDTFDGCINCGGCTFSCPTCWCFDIQDEVQKKEGDRIRNWDSCMFPLFTKHGMGHNPRDQKFQRIRQRFMHKLKYYPDKYDKGIMCVGCGRCVEVCPANIDIRRVAELMNNYSK